jgi:hypothetical protein
VNANNQNQYMYIYKVPREYFADEGTIPVVKREQLLKEAGHRRLSIDLLTSETMKIITSRKYESGTLVSSLILAGFDIDEIYQLDLEESASSKVRPLLRFMMCL